MDYEQAVALEAAQDHSLRELSAAAPAMPAAASIGAPARATASETIIAALPAEGTRPSVAYRQAGDGYLLLEYGDNVLDLALRMRIHLLMERCASGRWPACGSCRRACVPCRSATTAA